MPRSSSRALQFLASVVGLSVGRLLGGADLRA
jgi:hypothetical protein